MKRYLVITVGVAVAFGVLTKAQAQSYQENVFSEEYDYQEVDGYETDAQDVGFEEDELAENQADACPPSPERTRGWFYLYPTRPSYYTGSDGPAGPGGFWDQYYF